ncbi:non-specific serine,threonine protein kinase, partial [Sarracenia purpurea var. burkii]
RAERDNRAVIPSAGISTERVDRARLVKIRLRAPGRQELGIPDVPRICYSLSKTDRDAIIFAARRVRNQVQPGRPPLAESNRDEPEFVGDFPEPEVLQIWENNFAGSIPQGWGTNTKPEIADLPSSKLAGSPPPISFFFLPDESGRGITGIAEEGPDLFKTIIWCGANS